MQELCQELLSDAAEADSRARLGLAPVRDLAAVQQELLP
jgi:hypothetical protein